MTVLFVNSVAPACGVHQFGLNLYRVLAQSERIQFHYCAPASAPEYFALMDAAKPDLVFWNFYPCTMPWVTMDVLSHARDRHIRQASIHHEVPVTGFDAYVYPDPTFQRTRRQLSEWYSMGRALPLPAPERPCGVPDVPVISSSGFGFGWKGHARLVEMVVREFAYAHIRLHLPYAEFGDKNGKSAREIERQCRLLCQYNAGIRLDVDNEFMEANRFVEWLSESDLNAYLYDEADASRGIASTTDHALAARRPIALTKTRMFRHLHKCDGIFVENNSLRSIMARGIEPLREVYDEFSDEAVLENLENVCESILAERTQYCRLLDDRDRIQMVPTVESMKAVVPEMMSRKIPEANVQQAWTLETVLSTGSKRVLCVGCFEDTAFETLSRMEGIEVVGIDPAVNVSLSEFRRLRPESFECVFSTSVIEHVENDEQFVRDLCDCLVPDGVCCLTADYRADWQKGQPLPATDCRLYTPADIERLGAVLKQKGCYWVDAPILDGAPDFHYQGHDYSFVALVFKKL